MVAIGKVSVSTASLVLSVAVVYDGSENDSVVTNWWKSVKDDAIHAAQRLIILEADWIRHNL